MCLTWFLRNVFRSHKELLILLYRENNFGCNFCKPSVNQNFNPQKSITINTKDTIRLEKIIFSIPVMPRICKKK